MATYEIEELVQYVLATDQVWLPKPGTEAEWRTAWTPQISAIFGLSSSERDNFLDELRQQAEQQDDYTSALAKAGDIDAAYVLFPPSGGREQSRAALLDFLNK